MEDAAILVVELLRLHPVRGAFTGGSHSGYALFLRSPGPSAASVVAAFGGEVGALDTRSCPDRSVGKAGAVRRLGRRDEELG